MPGLPPMDYSDANWDFLDLPKRLEGVLRCRTTEMSKEKLSMECDFKGFFGCDSKCGVTIEKIQFGGFVKPGETREKVKVILTELPDNPGTSVTNMVENLATMVYHQFLEKVPVDNIQWIEHYPANARLREEASFSEVKMLWDDERFSHPEWKHLK